MITGATDQISAATAGNHGMSLISNEKLHQLYAAMVKCRMLGERLNAFGEQRLLFGYDDAGMGMEASTVGVTIDLLPEDSVFMAHNGLIVDYLKGEPLHKLLGRVIDSLDGTGQFAQIASLSESHLDRVTEAALVNKAKTNSNISVAFLDANAASSGLCREAFRVAGAQQLPILFVCQNTPANEPESHNIQTGTNEFVPQDECCGFPCITVDGCDVVAIYRVATESIIHARKGNGPTLIDCRQGFGSVQDPIRNMEAYLSLKGLFNEELKFETAAFTRQLETVFEEAARFKNP